MKVGIIGAGFTGLSAAYQLTKEGHEVVVFERDSRPGGLAIGYKESGWEWTLEEHYHHWFTKDKFVLNLAKEIDFPVVIKRTKTSTFIDDSIYQLDSPQALLAFPKLSFIDRIRTVVVLAFLRYNPFWKPLEKINANKFLSATMGKKAYGTIWEPQLRNKMGKYADDVSLVWFWARIFVRTPALAYPAGGFLPFAQAIAKAVIDAGGTIQYNTSIENIHADSEGKIHVDDKGVFDKVIVTLPSFLFVKMTPSLPESYTQKLAKLKGLGATNLVLRLDEPFFKDHTYWLSICEKNAPIMVIVEHTNFMDKSHFNNEHIVYIGNYPSPESKAFSMTKEELLRTYDPFLKKINPDYEKHLLGTQLFKAPFAQPVIPENYSKMIPPFETPIPNIYLANIEQVYPWDRGTNYAVELGEKIAKIVVG